MQENDDIINAVFKIYFVASDKLNRNGMIDGQNIRYTMTIKSLVNC